MKSLVKSRREITQRNAQRGKLIVDHNLCATMINTESCLFQIHGDMAHRLVAGLWGPLCATLLSIRLGVKERDERVDSKRRFIPF